MTFTAHRDNSSYFVHSFRYLRPYIFPHLVRYPAPYSATYPVEYALSGDRIFNWILKAARYILQAGRHWFRYGAGGFYEERTSAIIR